MVRLHPGSLWSVSVAAAQARAAAEQCAGRRLARGSRKHIRTRAGFNSRTRTFNRARLPRRQASAGRKQLTKIAGWHVPRGRLTLARSVRRVRFPSGPLTTRAHGPTGRHRLGRSEIWVRFPVGPLINQARCRRQRRLGDCDRSRLWRHLSGLQDSHPVQHTVEYCHQSQP